jgi:PAT family beta-lactamase induction signal transducer AmpG
MIASQTALMAAIVLLGFQDPVSAPLAVGVGALLVATASATQDIIIDAFRIESLERDEQAAGMASYVAAYRIGMLVSGAGVIALTAWLEGHGLAKETVWTVGYAAAALLVLVGTAAVLIAPEPDVPRSAEVPGDAVAPLLHAAKAAVRELIARNAILAVLGLVMLYKLCDALVGALTGPFVLAIGYDKTTYAAVVNGVGLIATLAGGFVGGMVALAQPLLRALWIGALLQMGSNLAFLWLATVPASLPALTSAVLIEAFTGGLGTVIFVAYLSALCSSPAHTATHYALLTALAAVGRTLLASLSGYAAAMLGWPLYFLLTMVAAVPSLALLVYLRARGHFDMLGERGA